MFDLWGEAMPVPMPDLDLEAADISIKEKLAWERELMGVYLSEHPFSAFANKVASENTTLCGHVDGELVGQTAVVAGMVASARYLFTRDKRPFASVVSEDLDGRVEVVVWPKVYADTRDLWEEGNILLVEGKVRLRDDRVQLSCDYVRRYQPDAARGEEVVVSQPIEAPAVAEEPSTLTAPVESHRLVICITQTDDEDSDITCLYKVIDTLKEFPGRDEVKLCLTNGTKISNLRFSDIYTNHCPELRQRLVELVGEDGLRLELKVK
jgi:DNA polymerase-3 subunit alpha